MVNRFGDSNSAVSGGSSAVPGGAQCREVGGYVSIMSRLWTISEWEDDDDDDG